MATAHSLPFIFHMSWMNTNAAWSEGCLTLNCGLMWNVFGGLVGAEKFLEQLYYSVVFPMYGEAVRAARSPEDSWTPGCCLFDRHVQTSLPWLLLLRVFVYLFASSPIIDLCDCELEKCKCHVMFLKKRQPKSHVCTVQLQDALGFSEAH